MREKTIALLTDIEALLRKSTKAADKALKEDIPRTRDNWNLYTEHLQVLATYLGKHNSARNPLSSVAEKLLFSRIVRLFFTEKPLRRLVRHRRLLSEVDINNAKEIFRQFFRQMATLAGGGDRLGSTFFDEHIAEPLRNTKLSHLEGKCEEVIATLRSLYLEIFPEQLSQHLLMLAQQLNENIYYAREALEQIIDSQLRLPTGEAAINALIESLALDNPLRETLNHALYISQIKNPPADLARRITQLMIQLGRGNHLATELLCDCVRQAVRTQPNFFRFNELARFFETIVVSFETKDYAMSLIQGIVPEAIFFSELPLTAAMLASVYAAGGIAQPSAPLDELTDEDIALSVSFIDHMVEPSAPAAVDVKTPEHINGVDAKTRDAEISGLTVHLINHSVEPSAPSDAWGEADSVDAEESEADAEMTEEVALELNIADIPALPEWAQPEPVAEENPALIKQAQALAEFAALRQAGLFAPTAAVVSVCTPSVPDAHAAEAAASEETEAASSDHAIEFPVVPTHIPVVQQNVAAATTPAPERVQPRQRVAVGMPR